MPIQMLLNIGISLEQTSVGRITQQVVIHVMHSCPYHLMYIRLCISYLIEINEAISLSTCAVTTLQFNNKYGTLSQTPGRYYLSLPILLLSLCLSPTVLRAFRFYQADFLELTYMVNFNKETQGLVMKRINKGHGIRLDHVFFM